MKIVSVSDRFHAMKIRTNLLRLDNLVNFMERVCNMHLAHDATVSPIDWYTGSKRSFHLYCHKPRHLEMPL